MKTILIVIAFGLFVFGFLIPKIAMMILDFIDRQFTEALPDDEQISKQLDLD